MPYSQDVQERWEKMLQDPNPQAQMEALTQIGRCYFRPKTAQELTSGAIHTSGLARPQLSASLKDAVLKKLRDDDPRIRAEAALALVHWRDEKAISALQQSLKDPDRRVRLAAVQALATIGDPQFIAPLLEVAETDSEELVRAHALATMEKLLQERPREAEKGGKPPAARRTRGAVRTRGPAPAEDFLKRLEKIGRSEASPYVAFFAERVRKRLG